jgi:hypothetical protein
MVPRVGRRQVPHWLKTLAGLCVALAWSLSSPAQWVPACDGQIPQQAVSVGTATDGAPLYLARVDYMGGRQPGKVRRGVPVAHFSYAGRTVEARCYEVFTGQGSWVRASNGWVPQGALQVGREADGSPLYAARAYYQGSLQIGKVRPGFGGALIPFGGSEVKVRDYEVLTEQPFALLWSPARGDAVPSNALQAGREADGAPLYAAKAHYNGSVQPGKVRRGFGGALIPYGGQEVRVEEYKVLTRLAQECDWVRAQNGRVPAGAVQGGHEADGTPLYVARARYMGGVHPGKIRKGFGGAHITYAGKEIEVPDYEVLVGDLSQVGTGESY